MDVLTAIGPGPLTAGSVLLLVVVLILLGRLIPRSTHEARVADWRELAERWEKIAERERAINETYAGGMSELLEHARTSSRILTAMQGARDRGAP